MMLMFDFDDSAWFLIPRNGFLRSMRTSGKSQVIRLSEGLEGTGFLGCNCKADPVASVIWGLEFDIWNAIHAKECKQVLSSVWAGEHRSSDVQFAVVFDGTGTL